MEQPFIPTLSFWENGNTWYGSLGQARFYVATQEDHLTVQLWRGPLAKEFSEILEEASFPISQEGLGELADWVGQLSQALNQS